MENLEMSMKSKFWQNKRVLITGHEGFLGSWLTKTLFKSSEKTIGFDKTLDPTTPILNNCRKNIVSIRGNVANFNLLKKVIDKYEPQVIFHLAAETLVDKTQKIPLQTFKTNIQGTWNILEAARDKAFIESIVVASSDKAYGSHKVLPYKENMPLKGSRPYDVSKSCVDLLCYTYYDTYKMPVCTTRCGNIFGPGDYNFSRIIPDTIESILSNKVLQIRSDGKFTRDYIYVEDVVSGYIMLAENIKKLGLAGNAFNFSTEKPISVLDLVNRIYLLFDKKTNYKILKKAEYEIKHQFLSAQKARKMLNWKPKYSLEKGLVKTIKWYKEFLGK